ncbi:MAG TPA: TIGR01906 family membrane protein [Chloroflexi bacterium]|nr:TIGR01906 family membrane protein [Chloroflexota bacterium]
MKSATWPRLVHGLLVLALPIAMLVFSIRATTGHWFVQWEYHKPDFPPDPYGLSTAERVRLAQVCVDYLSSSAPLSLLADLRLPGGGPAFNARELRHMADVQAVYDSLTAGGIIALAALLGVTAALLASPHSRRRAPTALFQGSLLTIGLLAAVGAYMILNWNDFFTTFHHLFFEGDSWLFLHTDTLIRLFPVRFWMDVAAVIVSLLMLLTIAVGIGSWMWMRCSRSKR